MIQSILTTSEVIEQSGIAFQVRVVSSLAKKQETKTAQPDANPFLPYDPDLFVAVISPTHVALLNKFNLADHHLLIVTRAFEPQEALLTLDDCTALLICLTEIDGLGFYNAGPAAEPAQPHKHLQLIPFVDSSEPQLSIEPLLRFVRMTGTTGMVPGLPFLHAYAPMDPAWFRSAKGRRRFIARLLSLAAPRRGVDRRGETERPRHFGSIQSACDSPPALVSAKVTRIFRGHLDQCARLRRDLAGQERSTSGDPTEARSHGCASASGTAMGVMIS